MKTYTLEQLQDILTLHANWLQGLECGSRANLTRANLSGANHDKYTFVFFYGIGSEGRQTLYIPEIDKIWCGCFQGNMAEFEVKIKQTHPEGKHRKAYLAGVKFLKKSAKLYRKDGK